MLATVVALFALQAGAVQPSQSVAVPPAESRPTPRSAPGGPVAHTRAGRHGIEIDGNLIGTSEAGVNASVGGAEVSANGSGRGVHLTYSRWLDERAALQFSVGTLGADAHVSVPGAGAEVESAVVVPLLVGLKYQPFQFEPGDGVRPFVSAAFGAYVGNSAGVKAGTSAVVGARSESVPGARVGAGIDVLAGRHVTFAAGGGYRMVREFEQPIGGRTRFSGAEITLGMGVLLGGAG